MNIALLSEKYTPDIGGLAISTERLAKLLSSAGHRVRVFCPSPSLSTSEGRTLTQNGISILRFGTHKRVEDTLLDWFERIVEGHRRQPFDLLHAYYLTKAGFVAAYAGRYLGLPSVVSIRGNDIERGTFDPSQVSHLLFALQHASAVTTNASLLRVKAKVLVDRDIVLIPNGVDTEHFKPLQRNVALAQALGIADEPRIIGFVGELREKKGLTTLLSAYAQVVKTQPAALLIVGDIRAGEDQRIFDEFKSSIPYSKITVTGYVSNSDLPSYYSLMDVVVHPSLRDGMPNVLLEAMACEQAVIATPVGGALDVIEDGKNGRMVPVNDEITLAKVIEEILSDRSQWRHLGESARRTVQQKFTYRNELEGNIAVYRNLGLQG
jgi:glycosyltransferase involved in cell wall biosynthesis